jgi:hypothetical protein
MKLVKFYLPAISWTLVVLLLTLLPASDIPNTVFSRVPYFDKLVHMGIFMIFVILWYGGVYRAYQHRQPENTQRQYQPLVLLARIILAAIALGFAIELVQKEWTTLHRDFEWMDWLADTLGAFLGGAIAGELFKLNQEA